MLGTPITVENRTLVPLMTIILGYGSTGMGAKTQTPASATSESGDHGQQQGSTQNQQS